MVSHAGGEPILAETQDVSKSGIRLRTNQPLPTGLYVEVRWPSTALFGEVRHCREVAPDQFDVGIEVEDAVYGSAISRTEHVTRSTMALFLAGDLAPSALKAVGHHLEECPLCKRELASIEDAAL